jgi:hypothetical protein
MAVAVAAVLASGGQAVAAAHGGGAAVLTGGGVISTVAGGVGGPDPGTNVGLTPCGVTFIHGHLYVAELTRRPETLSSGALREMTPATSVLTTPVGTGVAGPTGDGGPATSATLSTCGATEDGSGNIVIADESTDEIRVAAASTGTFYGQPMTAGHIYAVAGDGAGGFAGDGGPATSAELSFPEGVTVDASGNLVIADTGNARVRVVAASTGTFYGQPMTAGDIYTVAGDGQGAFSGDFGPAPRAWRWTPPATS